MALYHSPKDATKRQLRLLSELANERGISFSLDGDAHCIACASRAIKTLLARKKDHTDYRPSVLRYEAEKRAAQRRGEQV